MDWVTEELGLTEQTRWTGSNADPYTGFMRLKGAKALDRRSLALLRELYVWREELSSKLDRASFRVAGNEVLFQLAQHPVRTPAELGRVRGIGRDTLERRGDDILAAIERGLAIPDSELPKVERQPRRVIDPAYEARLEALKRVRNRLATQYELAPGVLCPNGTLEAVARVVPEDLDALGAIREVRRWQVREFGPEMLAALTEPAPG